MRTDAFLPAIGIAFRNLRTAARTPSLLLPPVVAPLVFLAAFSGGLSAIQKLPGFDYTSGYVTYEFVFVTLQGAVFSGIFSGLTLARDFEEGVAQRLFVSVPHPVSVVMGYVLTALGRAPIVTVALFVAGKLAGMRITSSWERLTLLFVLSEVLAAAGALWASGVALRLRTLQAAPLIQIVAFLSVYIAPVFAPVAKLSHWLRVAAQVNPFTAILDCGRSLAEGRMTGLPTTAGITALLLGALYMWALSGAQREIAR
jgi:ABC-2 type transport system permease protein